MARKLYQSKSRMLKATPYQKDHSKMQRKLNQAQYHCLNQTIKIKKLKRQLTIDALFKNTLKRLYPNIYNEIVKKYKDVSEKEGKGK